MKLLEEFPIDIVIPVFNEGASIIEVIELLELNVKTRFRILICYDFEEDDTLEAINRSERSAVIEFIKNNGAGPCDAVKSGFNASHSECVIVYPGDDISNQKIIDPMYKKFIQGSDVVVASRFIPGGSMIGCPLVKSILVRVASFSLFMLSSIPVKDASNGFRLFSRKALNLINIQSTHGFTYSLEILVKCNRLKLPIEEVPAQWIERKEGKSNFKVFFWLKMYLRWYRYGLETTWFNSPITPQCLNRKDK
ncbi:glycosyltransferase family 2 protein [Gammaproteobacteria bacterium]|nr:glycosyltransferase family 2 protein [Gammaproteobacteria bacterium]